MHFRLMPFLTAKKGSLIAGFYIQIDEISNREASGDKLLLNFGEKFHM